MQLLWALYIVRVNHFYILIKTRHKHRHTHTEIEQKLALVKSCRECQANAINEWKNSTARPIINLAYMGPNLHP